jgi:hypothetical protein
MYCFGGAGTPARAGGARRRTGGGRAGRDGGRRAGARRRRAQEPASGGRHGFGAAPRALARMPPTRSKGGPRSVNARIETDNERARRLAARPILTTCYWFMLSLYVSG